MTLLSYGVWSGIMLWQYLSHTAEKCVDGEGSKISWRQLCFFYQLQCLKKKRMLKKRMQKYVWPVFKSFLQWFYFHFFFAVVQVGDVVIPCYTPECLKHDCIFCQSPKTNLCPAIRSTQVRVTEILRSLKCLKMFEMRAFLWWSLAKRWLHLV